MKNILIIEDQKPHMEALTKVISQIENVHIYKAYNVAEAYYMLSLHHMHLFLVDIILDTSKSGDVSGLDFVRDIRQNKRYEFMPVIFITSLEDPQLYSYSQLHCFGYIEKPFEAKQVENLVREALQFPALSSENRNLYFRIDGIIYSVRVDDIIYIENSRRRLGIHCVNDYIEVPYKTANEILEELDSPHFIPCSRYAIVNQNYIERIDFTNRYLKLRGVEESIEIGAIMKKRFKDSIMNITEEEKDA